MKIRILLILAVLSFVSCQKKEIVFTENPSLHQPKVLSFNELMATNPFITPSGKTIIKALAYGDGLNFTWKANHGSFSGNDSVVEYSNSTIGDDTIICEVKDKYGKVLSKQIKITVTTDLIFSSLFASDTLMPLNYQTTLTATASGEDITYSWSANEGNIAGSGTQVTFTAPHTGDFEITCTVKDKYNNSVIKKITLTASNQLIFKSLTANPETIHLNENSTVNAVAYGEELTYTWSARTPSGFIPPIYGSGSSIMTTICHAESFIVTCIIKDKFNNAIEKNIRINVIE